MDRAEQMRLECPSPPATGQRTASLLLYVAHASGLGPVRGAHANSRPAAIRSLPYINASLQRCRRLRAILSKETGCGASSYETRRLPSPIAAVAARQAHRDGQHRGRHSLQRAVDQQPPTSLTCGRNRWLATHRRAAVIFLSPDLASALLHFCPSAPAILSLGRMRAAGIDW
ncbi:hypothetical protein P154DRAFT_574185 [Amniculicola lignicola CBS 123094]|uniref:Uncharacterized protein n=1 Tax=Amniculicola lignicola CBS 123094 TaxID=1392246 RepID=A0A6A5WT42_9PLEO|nr:hypothetical protein P154DRAFT_574185 [Amniculicola lignicola CBS 123094]